MLERQMKIVDVVYTDKFPFREFHSMPFRDAMEWLYAQVSEIPERYVDSIRVMIELEEEDYDQVVPKLRVWYQRLEN
jgi:hypothetical protein